MVTGVLNDSTNQPTKKPKQQRSHSEQDKKSTICNATANIPATQQAPMPKALTASLPVFDGVSKKFELLTTSTTSNITLHFPLLQLNLKINSTTSPIRSVCIHTLCHDRSSIPLLVVLVSQAIQEESVTVTK